jgi:hypothetical protein
MNLFARSPDAFIHGASIDCAPYEDLGLTGYLRTSTESHISIPYSKFSHRMRIQLLLRPDRHDIMGKSVYQACLACKGQKDKRPFSIRVVMTELGQFKRLAAYTQKEKDPEQFDLDTSSPSSTQSGWTLTDVYIPSPRPSVAPRQSLKVYTHENVTVILDGSALALSRLRLKMSSWPILGVVTPGEIRFNIDCSDWDIITREDADGQNCGALIFQDSVSRGTFGIALTVSNFRLQATFIDHGLRPEFMQPFQTSELGIFQWQETSMYMLSKELKDGRVLYMNSEDDFEKGIVRLRVGIRGKS